MKVEIKQQIKNTFRTMKMETQLSKMYGTQQKQSKKEVHTYIGLPQETKNKI